MNPAATAISFLEGPEQVDWSRVCFQERLAAHGLRRPPPGAAPIGFQVMSVEQSERDGSPTFTVLVHRNYHLGGVEVRSELMAVIERDLQTIQQHWKQTAVWPDRQQWRQLHLVRERHQFAVQTQQGATGHEPVERLYRLNRSKMRFLYSEGALVVLQRLVAVRDHQEPVHGTAMEICGRIYPFTIEHQGWKPLAVAGALRCVRLAKTLARGNYGNESFAHLTPEGTLVAQAVHAWPVRVEALHLLRERPPLDWELDLQLVSVFTDRKLELRALFERYLREHPDVRRLLADFLQAVLVWKPEDVTEFAENFFTSYSVTYKSGEQNDQEAALNAALASVHGDWDESWLEPKAFTE
ncbi:Ciliogenesis-associated TTC17-interacting protein [Amphibalanus amphitrite]|uniref:Ciliogenesis-associated TTC17-interacting protein n=1 Tax=Amphibalanus amphitrite TaxID=1232801 RepID=A0A6A4WMR0_AMPAM|nr:Ciliogenesis-associated TTC17-interacting protein [Amphibalanus amphitrite]